MKRFTGIYTPIVTPFSLTTRSTRPVSFATCRDGWARRYGVSRTRLKC